MGSTAGKLVDRLRGIYTVPVNDGAGLLNGKDTFTQTFPVAPIQHEAAGEIERLQGLIKTAVERLQIEADRDKKRAENNTSNRYIHLQSLARSDAYLHAIKVVQGMVTQ